MASSGSLSTTGYKGRYLVLNWSQVSQSIADNTTTISWSLEGAGYASFSYCYARNFTVVINGETVYYAQGNSSEVKLYNGTVVASGTLVIHHDSDGNKSFSASVAAGIYDWSPTCTGSGTFYLNKIPRLSSLSVSNGSLGTAQTLTVTKQNSSFTHTIIYKCGTVSGTIVTKSSSTNINWTPPMSLASQNTTGTLVSISFTIETYSGSDSVGSSSKTISCSIPDSVRPTCVINVERVPLVTDYYDANWWMSNDVYIQGITKVQSNIVANESYGSSISSYSVKMDNSTYNGQSVTMAAPSNSGNITITATVTDKRGRSGSATKTINVLPCPSCQITKLSGIRCNNDGASNDRGEYILMNYAYDSGFFTTEYGSNNGSAMAEVYYKKHSDSAWTLLAQQYDIQHFPPSSWTSDEVKAASLFQADTANSYDLKLVVSDYFNTVTMTGRVGTAYSLIHWKASGKGMGIGKTSELDDVLDIGMSTKFSGGITPIELESGTDLNDVVLPNVYYGNGVSDNYPNFPMSSTSSVGFSLEVLKSGTSTIKQRITVTKAASPDDYKVFERIHGESAWSNWFDTSDFTDSGALRLTGGTMVASGSANGRITIPGLNSGWQGARDKSGIIVTNGGDYTPAISMKSANYTWDIATYSDNLEITKFSDTNYNAGSNVPTKEFTLREDGIVGLQSTKLLANGSLSSGGSLSGTANLALYRTIYILFGESLNGANQYYSFTCPFVADQWGIYLPAAGDYYRAKVVISSAGQVTVSMLSSVTRFCFIYACL